jgi:hypothetical protein
VHAARPFHHSLFGERSPSPTLCGAGEEQRRKAPRVICDSPAIKGQGPQPQ